MTPRQADKLIKTGAVVWVTTYLDHTPFPIKITKRDRWNVYTEDGMVLDRGHLTIHPAPTTN